MNLFPTIILGAALTVGISASAQEFDLSSQRKEVQHVKTIPGEKIDHQGIVINPTPHQIQVDRSATINVADGFTLIPGKGAFSVKSAASDFPWLKLSPKGTKIWLNYGAKVAKAAGVKAVKGAYKLDIDKKGVKITGFDEAGAFYGMQTLRQLLESPIAGTGTLPYLAVNDYPDLPLRGVVEGFYGNPWSHEVRMSLIDFYGKNKMNNYLYGPKDDPYHSTPHWRQPYPAEEAKKIHELVEASKRNRVDFIWAIHPGQDIRWNEADYDSLVNKFNMMYDLGVRSFAIFFDDISGEGTSSEKQVDLLNRLNREFVQAKGDVSDLVICPTDYSRLWANPGPDGQLAYYGNHLDPSVQVFYTGDVVCSDLTAETMQFLNERIKRPGLYWWNFPVTDYARHIVMQGPTYGLDTSLTSNEVAGLESNPMEHGEASKLALYGVADYSWNIAPYNPIDNWERALAEIAPEATEAYRTFAIHSGDTESGYRRDESWETETFAFNDYTHAQFDALAKEFAKIQAVPAQMQAISNKGLLAELNPWLTEFGKLGLRGTRTLDLIKVYEQGNHDKFWNAYVANLMTDADRAAYNAHKSGTMKLQPFYENAMDDMLTEFFKIVSGKVPTNYTPIGSYASLNAPGAKLMLDGDSTTYYHSGAGQKAGHWIGLDLGTVRPVEEVTVIQGRNSVNDVDYFDNVILEASADGKQWTALTDSLKGVYDILWAGEPVNARYVRITKLPSEKQSWCAVRTFEVNPATAERVGMGLEAADIDQALMAFDENPATIYDLAGTISFDKPADASELIILLGKSAPLTITQTDAKGNLLESTKTSGAYAPVKLNAATARIAVQGTAPIHEVIVK